MLYHDLSSTRLRRLAQGCAALVVLVALAAFAGWLFDWSPATAFRSRYIPMAPGTAFCFLLLGSGLFFFATGQRWRYLFGRACGALVLLIAFIRLLELLVGSPRGIDDWFFAIPERTLGMFPVGRMSPLTAIALLLASGVMLMFSWSAQSRWLNSVAGGVAVIVAFVGLVFSLGYAYRHPLFYGGEIIPMALNTALSFFLLGTGYISVSAARESGERRVSRRRQKALHAVTRTLADFEDPDLALPEALRAVCAELKIDYAAVWTISRQDGRLRCTHVWHKAENASDLFETVSRELPFARGEDLPGRVERAREPVWYFDITAERALPRAAAALEAGLHGAFCGPMMVGNEFLGCVEFLSREYLDMDPGILRTLTDVCVQIGQYVRRKQADQILRENELRTRLIIETANDAFIESNATGEITDWNRQAEIIFGWSAAEALGRQLVETIVPPKARTQHELRPENLTKTGEGSLLNRRVETTAVHRDGHIFPVELTVWPIESGGALRFNAFVRDITERKRAEEEIAAKTAEIQQELEIAREFQEALLPHDYPQVPDRNTPDPLELHFHHVYKPAFTVGGDFFDVVKLSEHRAGIFVADVMGHGARSALITAILRTLLQDLAQETDDPGRFLELLNQHYMDIVERSHQFVFASAFYLIIDTEAATASCASAGHPSPLLGQREEGRVTTLVDYGRNGPALGFLRDATYESFKRPVQRDDLFILFTDGVVEATDRNFEEFGYERFSQVIRDRLQGSLAEISQGVVDSLFRFTGSSVLNDDLCLVLVEAAGRSPAPPARGRQEAEENHGASRALDREGRLERNVSPE